MCVALPISDFDVPHATEAVSQTLVAEPSIKNLAKRYSGVPILILSHQNVPVEVLENY
jgi:hypothetical protein